MQKNSEGKGTGLVGAVGDYGQKDIHRRFDEQLTLPLP